MRSRASMTVEEYLRDVLARERFELRFWGDREVFSRKLKIGDVLKVEEECYFSGLTPGRYLVVYSDQGGGTIAREISNQGDMGEALEFDVSDLQGSSHEGPGHVLCGESPGLGSYAWEELPHARGLILFRI